MDFIERALAARSLPTIIEEEEILSSSTEASPPAGPTDSCQRPSALRAVESSSGGGNSLDSISREVRVVLAAMLEGPPYSRLNRPYRESALGGGPRLVRNPSHYRVSDSSEGILDRNAVLDPSGGVASEADINDYRQWCFARLASSRQGARPLDLSVASEERSPLSLSDDACRVPHDGTHEPAMPSQQAASSSSIGPGRLGHRSDTSDTLSFNASEEHLRRQRALPELARLEPRRARMRSGDPTLREFTHIFALQRGEQAGPSVVDPAGELGFQNQEAARPSSTAPPLHDRQRLDRTATGPMHSSEGLDFGAFVGPDWVHRDQPAPAPLIRQLRQRRSLPSSSQRQRSIYINGVSYTVVQGPSGPRDIRLFRNRHVPLPQSHSATP